MDTVTITPIEKSQGAVVVRNTFINLFSRILLVPIGIFSLQFIIKGMGAEPYGLFSLAWTIISFMAVLDFGIGTAVTRYLAQELGLGRRDRMQSIFWTAFTMLLGLGIIFSLILAIITPFLIENIMHTPEYLSREGKIMFWILAVAIPFLLMNNSLRGGLEAAQRFDIVNLIRTPYNAALYLFPLIGYFIGWRIDIITCFLLIPIIMAFVAYSIGMIHVYPWIFHTIRLRLDEIGKISKFSGWVAVSNGLAAVFIYAERLLITTTLSLTFLGYFTAPYDALTRIWIIPMSITAVLLPVFSENNAQHTSIHNDEQMVSFSLKFIFLIIGPLTAFIAIYSKEILTIWLGPEYAMNSATVALFLAIGIFFNSFGRIPATLLYGKERPDLPAKLYLVELPIYLCIGYLLMMRWGIAGAALAWSVRAAFDTILLFYFIIKLGLIRFNQIFTKSFSKYIISLIGLAISFLLIKQYLVTLSISSALIIMIISIIAFGFIVWITLLEGYEKTYLLKLFHKSIPNKTI